MNVEIAIPSLFNTKKKQGENGTETQLENSMFHYVHLATTQLLSYTEVIQYYPDGRLITACSLALLQSTIKQLGSKYSSSHHLPEAALRGAPIATLHQPYRGSSSSSKHPRHAAGISHSSENPFSLSVHPTTLWTVHSLLLHYFFLAPSSFQLTAHTPQWSGSLTATIYT